MSYWLNARKPKYTKGKKNQKSSREQKFEQLSNKKKELLLKENKQQSDLQCCLHVNYENYVWNLQHQPKKDKFSSMSSYTPLWTSLGARERLGLVEDVNEQRS